MIEQAASQFLQFQSLPNSLPLRVSKTLKVSLEDACSTRHDACKFMGRDFWTQIEHGATVSSVSLWS